MLNKISDSDSDSDSESDRVRRLTTCGSKDWWSCVRSLPQDIYIVHCWLINLNKLNQLSWLLAYLSDKINCMTSDIKKIERELECFDSARQYCCYLLRQSVESSHKYGSTANRGVILVFNARGSGDLVVEDDRCAIL